MLPVCVYLHRQVIHLFFANFTQQHAPTSNYIILNEPEINFPFSLLNLYRNHMENGTGFRSEQNRKRLVHPIIH